MLLGTGVGKEGRVGSENKKSKGAELHKGRWEGSMKPLRLRRGKLYLPHNAPPFSSVS